MPRFWVVAGPNGAGKTTLVRSGVLDAIDPAPPVSLNADARTTALLAFDPRLTRRRANLIAARQIDAHVEDCISRGISFVVETVLSSNKYQDDVLRALEAGFWFGFIYIALRSPKDAHDRIADRVRKGGHAVPRDAVESRFNRSLDLMPWFLARATWARIYDNSDPRGRPIALAEKQAGKLRLFRRGINEEIDRRIQPLLHVR